MTDFKTIIEKEDWKNLVKLLSDKNVDIRKEAIKTAREMKKAIPHETLKVLKEIFQNLLNDKDMEIRYETIITLNRLAIFFKDYQVSLLLSSIIDDETESFQMRAEAEKVFNQIGLPLVKNHTDLGKEIEKMILRFCEVLLSSPKIAGEITHKERLLYKEIVTVILSEQEKVDLKLNGRAYDYNESENAKWNGGPTKVQIEKLIKEMGKIPQAIRFYIEDNFHPNAPSNSIILEFPYYAVEKILKGLHTAEICEIPYKIAGGIIKVRIPGVKETKKDP